MGQRKRRGVSWRSAEGNEEMAKTEFGGDSDNNLIMLGDVVRRVGRWNGRHAPLGFSLVSGIVSCGHCTVWNGVQFTDDWFVVFNKSPPAHQSPTLRIKRENAF